MKGKTFSKSLLVAVLTWVFSALGGALLFGMLIILDELFETETSESLIHNTFWFSIIALMASLAALIITVPLNIILLLFVNSLPSTINVSIRTFFLVSLYSLLVPVVLAILPNLRIDILENMLSVVLTTAAFITIALISFVLINKNYKRSILIYILLNVIVIVTIDLFSMILNSIESPWNEIFFYSYFHVSGTLALVLLTRKFKLLNL